MRDMGSGPRNQRNQFLGADLYIALPFLTYQSRKNMGKKLVTVVTPHRSHVSYGENRNQWLVTVWLQGYVT
jgi:hypothetical protein